MTDRDLLRQRLVAGLAALDSDLATDAVERLLDYLALLARWNATYNLSAVRDPLEMVTRHLLDSLAVAPFVRGDTLVDLGTGPGLPGISLAIAAPERRVTLVDSNGKKTRFLRAAVRELKLDNVDVVEGRVESVQGRYDCVTARAFASLSDMLAWGGHLLAPGGVWLALKGRVAQDELDTVKPPFSVRSVRPLAVPGLEAERCVVIIGGSGGPAGNPGTPARP